MEARARHQAGSASVSSAAVWRVAGAGRGLEGGGAVASVVPETMETRGQWVQWGQRWAEGWQDGEQC